VRIVPTPQVGPVAAAAPASNGWMSLVGMAGPIAVTSGSRPRSRRSRGLSVGHVDSRFRGRSPPWARPRGQGALRKTGRVCAPRGCSGARRSGSSFRPPWRDRQPVMTIARLVGADVVVALSTSGADVVDQVRCRGVDQGIAVAPRPAPASGLPSRLVVSPISPSPTGRPARSPVHPRSRIVTGRRTDSGEERKIHTHGSSGGKRGGALVRRRMPSRRFACCGRSARHSEVPRPGSPEPGADASDDHRCRRRHTTSPPATESGHQMRGSSDIVIAVTPPGVT
jgi:hypothetical protein